MYFVALKMLFNDKAKFFGIVMGVTLASLVITQQGSIFVGLMARTFGVITDMNYPDIWVMDPKVQFIDDTKPLTDTKLFEVRGVEVRWRWEGTNGHALGRRRQHAARSERRGPSQATSALERENWFS